MSLGEWSLEETRDFEEGEEEVVIGCGVLPAFQSSNFSYRVQ